MKHFPTRKTYGSYKTFSCPFCHRTGTSKNSQGLDVCKQHINNVLEEIKCTCCRWLEPKSGKFGPYFHCENCGNMNYDKGMKIKEMTTPFKIERIETKPMASSTSTYSKLKPKETTITSDDVEYFD